MRNFSQAKRIVIKVGTNVLSRRGQVDTDFLKVIAGQIAALVQQKRQVILVTSGAIGMGATALGLKKQVTEVKMRQACAAVGQGVLMHEYQAAFAAHGQQVGQVLLTNRIMSQRKYYVNLKNAMETLLSLGIVPIVNENDCVSVEEIDLAFGDNDRLSALVASKIDAELLIILTDVAGLYDRNPQQHRDAKLIPVVYEVTDKIVAGAGKAGSKFATGGMASKIQAIRIAAEGGCRVVLAHGREPDVVTRVLQGDDIGTLFLPKRRLSNRKRWILNSQSHGEILVDDGAEDALRHRRSLLLVGVTAVEGAFRAGEVVQVGKGAKGISTYSSTELRDLLAKRKGDEETIGSSKAVVHVDNLVVIDA